MYERTESKVERWIPGRVAKNESNRSDRQDKMRSQVKNEPRGPLLKENIEGEDGEMDFRRSCKERGQQRKMQ